VIAQNSGRLGKTLWTDLEPGDKVARRRRVGRPEEARRIGEELESLQRQRVSLDRAAILVRAQFQTREFEDRFIAIGMPYRIVGGFRFYERAEIRDALAYLRLVQSAADDLAFERIVNTPKRGLGDKALAASTNSRATNRRRCFTPRAHPRNRRADAAGAAPARAI
jgi:DNA helicase-2/ATP-dependent DNA helicase PcrA